MVAKEMAGTVCERTFKVPEGTRFQGEMFDREGEFGPFTAVTIPWDVLADIPNFPIGGLIPAGGAIVIEAE